ncbi:hypothetical protein [Psychrobacter frigidicola]|uniref:hypothetical protein n=1 Tax=Psychrobacter frigidicola TaxID=45611 RepID=UPI0019191BD7|nr:hypothetical protein [Psychrobacter frigidicola]
MYDQLKNLEKTILDIKKQYQLVSVELNSCKQQQNTDPKELATLKSKLDNSYAERDTAKKQFIELDKRYQSLAEAHHMIGEDQDKLQKQLADLQQQNKSLQQHNHEVKQKNSDLQKQNHDLQEKNQLASERTEVVLKRLTRIDQVDG